jgi:hypothetical protein
MSEPNALRRLGDWIGQRRVEYLRIHDATFKRTFRAIPFAEHQRALERIVSELESVDGRTPFEMPSALSPAEEEFIEVLDPYLAALIHAVRALATICAPLATEAAGTRTGSYKTFREDVRQYEIVAGGYAKLGDRLSVLHRSLPQ